MINLSPRMRRRHWAMQNRMAMSIERPLTTKLRREFHRVTTLAAEQYHASMNVDLTNLRKHHAAMLLKIVKPHVRAAFAIGSRAVIEAFGKASLLRLAVKAGPDDPSDNEIDFDAMVESYIEDVNTRISDISDTTMEKISTAIKDGLDADESQDQIAQDIVDASGGQVSEARARTIARTEIHGAMQTASLRTAEQLDIPGLQKQWSSMDDDRVRPDHADVDGTIVAMDDVFEVGDDELDCPGDPSGSPEETINCRCVLSYVTGDES